jgi:hypothetical protein
MNNHLRDLCGIAGMALICWGAWLVYTPAGVILVGLCLLLLALFGFNDVKKNGAE